MEIKKQEQIKEKEERVEKVEKTMRLLANFLIDRFLEDKKNNRLTFILERNTIKLD